MSQTFTNPFRYVPHPLVRKAAGRVMERLDRLIAERAIPEEVCRGFSEGKMLGVLLCRHTGNVTPADLCHIVSDPEHGTWYFLAAFSGSVGGYSIVEGFVPPIYDLLEPKGHFKEREAKITDLSKQISATVSLLEFKQMQLEDMLEERNMEISALREKKSRLKRERELILKEWETDGRETLVYRERFVRESQHENAEYKRAKDRWKEIIGPMETEAHALEEKIRAMKQQRAGMSEELQKWIFSQYRVMNGLGEESSILDIFAAEGLVPPGGTGDCAAPKLLNYAFRHGLEPVAMGEFWYGKSPDTAVRTPGHFYPSCTSKCRPLLKYMLKGLDWEEGNECPEPGIGNASCQPSIIFEDEAIIVIDKPSGMPSVPGLDGRTSAQEWLADQMSASHEKEYEIHAVHRLDMDTSGILLFAKTAETAVNLRRQFEEHSVRKTYRALLCSPHDTHPSNRLTGPVSSCKEISDSGAELSEGERGTIALPLAPDYDERPRQKVDMVQGKPALTEYEVIHENPDGTTEVLFHPVTGRTHQLRIHSAHHLGLGRPIVGDLLYGGALYSSRLRLHAEQISFIHPVSGRNITLTTQA